MRERDLAFGGELNMRGVNLAGKHNINQAGVDVDTSLARAYRTTGSTEVRNRR